jgi:hypothetical protein
MKKLDPELQHCAALALRNAFWHDFSALVNEYLAAGKGLEEVEDQDRMLAELTSFFGRDENAGSFTFRELMLVRDYWIAYPTIAEALKDSDAKQLTLKGKKIFERDEGGEWEYVEQN